MNRSRPALLAALAALVLVVLFAPALAAFVTDWTWFDGLGFSQVFTTVVLAKLGLGVVVGLVVAAILWANALWAARISARSTRVRVAGGAEPPTWMVQALEGSNLPRLAALVSLVVGLFMGLGATAWWDDLLLLLHGGPFDWTDPVLGHDASFYVFTLPLVRQAQGLASFLLALCLASAAAIHLGRGSIRVDLEQQDGRVLWGGIAVDPKVRTQGGVLVLLLAVAVAAGTWLRRYDLMVDTTGLITGPGYTDAQYTLPLLALQALLTLVAGILLYLATRRLDKRLGLAALVVVAVGWALTALVPEAVQRFLVLPNELTREEPYILDHMAATREAFDLEKTEIRLLSGEAELDISDIEANQATIENVRLWDHVPLLETFAQVQEIRTYYEFVSVDNDRYVIDGRLRQIMLSPRELVSTGLPDRARTWVNESLVYTHGYGLTLGPVNQVTEQGLPELFIQDLPPEVRFPGDLDIERPELYYGEAMGTAVFVGTETKEFDYPAGQENVYTDYAGKGGAPVGGLVTRALWALRLGSTKVLLTEDFNQDTRVMIYRRVLERARRIAPFLVYDADPYLVISEGRLVWVLDAYTTTSRFPYAQPAGRLGNYVRNSVKVTIDAYDGDPVFWLVDPDDPVARAWGEAFPDLLTPLDEMSPSLQAHLRYPQDLFRSQTWLYAIYHMTDPTTFYNREDEWEIPAPDGQRMDPYYMVMRLPDEAADEFIVMLPFVPRDKPNLAAWMVGRSDGEHLGELLAYTFPKDKMVYGPSMIVARINQDAFISEKLSLWNQQGSRAVRGTLLVIPIEESLLYVQPLYLQAENGSIPELKRVIVGYEDEIAMEPTLERALERIFGRSEVVEEATAPREAGEPAPGPALPAAWQDLVQRVSDRYDEAVEAQRAGDWAAYGDALEDLESGLRELRDRAGASDSAEEPEEGQPGEGSPE